MFTSTVPATSAFQAEIFAMIRAFQHLIKQRHHHHRVLVESDCLFLVEILQHHQPQPWQERHLLAVLHELLSQCPNASFHHVSRDANLAADWAAKAHRANGSISNWLVFTPFAFQNIVLTDALLAGCMHMFV